MKLTFNILLLLLLFITPVVHATSPASLSFDPIQQTTTTGQKVEVAVNIFTNNQAVASTDIWIKYDPNIVVPLPNEVENGSLFQSIDAKIVTPGSLYIYGIQNNPSSSTPLLGTVATIKFQTLREGATDIGFECAPYKKQTSTIIAADRSLSNIISCPSTIAHTGRITVEEGGILGASTGKFSISPMYLVLGLVLLLTVFLFYRYRSMSTNL
ncbi:hypothetical protein A3A93_04885 [Candidatus Roizmanbacteria bacterium RIFCSPLOWO2_01_FULL_38_12]|uniref:Cohesin domain-containing protein n=1 Tax=Candidatus Roizmanbacteria bacterium RIFCSPLOWO2_01_FULL_38_12 TaxID=1802061 RepID=A0A1F7IW36_9BACT|nr:MAG: hypothetical protein A3F59_06135 [Candidatus Roizmanbacteria bacterium RIFCSPHIGHO2_12_FULL_38_13]OGK47544.1 MAG: hypothetical protein A3A93_04885 [Candidatus Roizmanbacteria bacterium RIFCSPLOWO2_01_FULL_38_12]